MPDFKLPTAAYANAQHQNQHLNQHLNQQSAITVPLCALTDLVPYSGVAAHYHGHCIALFYLPDQQPAIYAVGHLDPLTQAPIIAHGLIGESKGEFYVASPLHKQQYRLRDGVCLQQPELQLPTYVVANNEGKLWLLLTADDLQDCA